MAYYLGADRSIIGTNSGTYTGGPAKTVLHTTESGTASSAIAAFKSSGSWPHFLVDYIGKIWQFIDSTKAARALVNAPGGAETNRDHAIQIEIVGFAGKPSEHPVAQWDALRKLMRWIEATEGVKPIGPGRPFATAYGQNNLRFTSAEWDSFGGICGHCHVPEGNVHWDPGAIDLVSLLPSAPIPPPTGFKVPASYYTEVTQVPFTIPRSQGGHIVVGADGGVFTYDGAPFYGSLGGTTLNNPIIAGAWSLTGAGYWLMSSGDGAVFGFGDAAYKGGFNSFPPEVRGNRKPIGIVAKGNGYLIIILDPSQDGSPFDSYGLGV